VTHLDTTFLVDLLREQQKRIEGPALAKLDELADEPLVVSLHVACELRAGAELSVAPGRERERVEALLRPMGILLPDERFVEAYARLLAELTRRGQIIPAMDLLIATAAVLDDAAIVTRNVQHFERVPGLTVISY
jgi:tRNA(fMet)-specific endonuclease VapC